MPLSSGMVTARSARGEGPIARTGEDGGPERVVVAIEVPRLGQADIGLGCEGVPPGGTVQRHEQRGVVAGDDDRRVGLWRGHPGVPGMPKCDV